MELKSTEISLTAREMLLIAFCKSFFGHCGQFRAISKRLSFQAVPFTTLWGVPTNICPGVNGTSVIDPCRYVPNDKYFWRLTSI